MFSKLSLLMAVMWCSAAEATVHDVSQLCEDSARRFAADRVRAEEKVIALGVWCRKMSPEYDAVKCATAAAAVDLEALVFRTEGEVLLKECTQAAPEGGQRKAAVQNREVGEDQPHLDVVLTVAKDTDALLMDIEDYVKGLENQADLTAADVNQLLTTYNESLQSVSSALKTILAALNGIVNNIR